VRWTQRRTLPVAGSPRGVAVADLNRDGKLDLAVTGASCHCVAILRNDGGGAFTEVTRVSGANQPHVIAVGDFNRDDLPDLVVASTGASAIEVLLGDGFLGFTRQRFGPAPGTRALVVLDYDRDGWLDVVTANAGVPILSVFRNEHGVLRYTAVATTGIDYSAADRRGIAVVNMNGDGWPDLVVSVRSAGRIEQFKGTGTRFFPDGSTDDVGRPPPPAGGARAIAVADIDQNGRPDLIVGNEYDRSVSVLSNLSEWHQ
jgi:hypothetical protein